MTGVLAVSPKPGVVILTDKLEIAPLVGALEAGVDGYLLKDMSSDSLRQSLELVLTGEKVFPTALTGLLVDDQFALSLNAKTGDRAGALSNRETEILTCLVNGHSNKTIANQLHIMEGTVKVHLKGILKKIRVRNRTQAAIWAIHNGIMASPIGELRSIKANSCDPAIATVHDMGSLLPGVCLYVVRADIRRRQTHTASLRRRAAPFPFPAPFDSGRNSSHGFPTTNKSRLHGSD